FFICYALSGAIQEFMISRAGTISAVRMCALSSQLSRNIPSHVHVIQIEIVVAVVLVSRLDRYLECGSVIVKRNACRFHWSEMFIGRDEIFSSLVGEPAF